jgi:hypothetical protein
MGIAVFSVAGRVVVRVVSVVSRVKGVGKFLENFLTGLTV